MAPDGKRAWLVEPVNRTLQVFRSAERCWVLVSAFAGDERLRAEPFADVELELGALWGDS